MSTASFEKEMEALRPRLVRVATRSLPRRRKDDAEDVVQLALMKAWLARKRFRGEAALYSWLYRITVNEALQMYRTEKAQFLPGCLSLDEGLSRGKEIPILPDLDTGILLAELLATVPGKDREVVRRKYVEGYSFKELSNGRSVSAVKFYCSRVLRRLRENTKSPGRKVL